ncbi:hypothetical protein ACFY2R_18115 [Micromonospora olivasterospora]|uniref:Uncharacterized protein n=1 Tax=Micromonospora olivasterospora TaxID=1880 RepID=A0A562HV55_MICOL|nr:hypothetical protein [Micromonospora olivasterospora]TWH62295.1 hypothetical protein JD77_06346 [Micromonospora olivasterospora]
MNAVVGCTAPEKWWADQRAKRRTVVLVIVLVFFTWLTGVEQLNVLEAAGLVAVIGIAAGMVIDRVIDGNRSSGEDLATLLRLVDGPGRS